MLVSLVLYTYKALNSMQKLANIEGKGLFKQFRSEALNLIVPSSLIVLSYASVIYKGWIFFFITLEAINGTILLALIPLIILE